MHFFLSHDNIYKSLVNSAKQTLKNIEAWLSLVERCVRDAEVASSNLVASILACWSSGQDDALSRRKPGFDSRTGHLKWTSQNCDVFFLLETTALTCSLSPYPLMLVFPCSFPRFFSPCSFSSASPLSVLLTGIFIYYFQFLGFFYTLITKRTHFFGMIISQTRQNAFSHKFFFILLPLFWQPEAASFSFQRSP